MEQNQNERQPRFLKWSLVLAIAIVSNLFINYALSLAYKEPTWDAFCPQQQVINPVTTEQECVSKGGQWNGNVPFAPDGKPMSKGYCDPNYTCQNNYNSARDIYERNVFVTLVVLGVILIIAGVFTAGGSVLRTALSLSGSLSILIASIRYWHVAHDWLKVLILGVALAALITLAVKKFRS